MPLRHGIGGRGTPEGVVPPRYRRTVHLDALCARMLGHPYSIAFAMRDLIHGVALQDTEVVDSRVGDLFHGHVRDG